MNIRAAAAKLSVPHTTAYGWLKKGKFFAETDDLLELRKSGSGRPVGRPLVLNANHEQFLVQLIDEKPDTVLDEMMENLTGQLKDIQISKSALYKYVTEKCNFSFKKVHFHSVERNSADKIEQRYE